MKAYLIQYFATLFTLLGLDAIWLWSRLDAYKAALGEQLTAQPNVPALAVFYLLYTSGVCYFVPEGNTDWKVIALRGFFFGIVAYGTYDMTNAGTLRQFPVSIAIQDMFWGGCLTAAAGIVASTLSSRG